MKKNKIKSAYTAVAACSLFGIVGIATVAPMANAEVSAPVGYVKLTFKANSDTSFSLPLDRSKVHAGQVVNASGDTINVAPGSLLANNYELADGIAGVRYYYVLFTTGPLEGQAFDIASNDTDSITLVNGDDETLQTQLGAGADNFDIRPHWTLNTLFPDGQDFIKSEDFSDPDALVMLRDENTIGINIPVTSFYVFLDAPGTDNDAWYNSNTQAAANNIVLKRGHSYAVKNKMAVAQEANVVGDVPLTDSSKGVAILSDFITQDNYLSQSFPIDITLKDSDLVSSGAFAVTTDFAARDGDLLFLYPDTVNGFNPAANLTYLYLDADGTANDGWYNADTQAASDDVLLKAGTTFILRKKGSTGEVKLNWKTDLPYLPFNEDPITPQGQ